MDEVAKSGVAAHWSYKEGKGANPKVSQQFSWIQNLIENQENIRDPREFMENVRIDLFPDEVYVFTPKGDIRSLTRGATPVDPHRDRASTHRGQDQRSAGPASNRAGNR